MNWYELRDPNDSQLDELAAKYRLHPLHIEDCRHRNQSAKVEAQDGYLFVVLKPVQMDEEGEMVAGDLDLFLGPDYLIVVEETNCAAIRTLLDRISAGAAGMRADQAFYRVIDGLIDSYPPLIDNMSEEIDRLEDKVLSCPEPPMLQSLFRIRRALIELRRILANSRDVMGHLLRSDYPQLGRDMMPFLRDVYDHIARNLDIIEVQRDLVTGATELYLSGVANQTNQVMKVLTVFGTIATPALVITGVYGMNLKHLPFAEHPHSWGIVIGMIAAVSLFMLLVLRKLKWL
jgi:magnesium transporter